MIRGEGFHDAVKLERREGRRKKMEEGKEGDIPIWNFGIEMDYAAEDMREGRCTKGVVCRLGEQILGSNDGYGR